MNRGRHRKKPNDEYPPEVNQLMCPEIFKKAFTPEQTKLLLKRQMDAKNPPDLTIFETNYSASKFGGGFDWDQTPEGFNYWNDITWNYHLIQNS